MLRDAEQRFASEIDLYDIGYRVLRRHSSSVVSRQLSPRCYPTYRELPHKLAPSLLSASTRVYPIGQPSWCPPIPSYKRALALITPRVDADFQCIRRLRTRIGRLRARRFGNPSGVPAFCVPGLSSNCRAFEALGERFERKGRSLVAFDLRGRGWSDITAPERSAGRIMRATF